jgi:RNA polymerase sigma-70 factor (ECF subfamily)
VLLERDAKRTFGRRLTRYSDGALDAQHHRQRRKGRAMFATVSPIASLADRDPLAAPAKVRRQHRSNAPQTLDEAYEIRLLAEVARWDDQAAFEEIYDRHRAAVARAARQICRDAATAEEIVQLTFTALWARAARLVDKSVRLRPWLTVVARNAAIDHVRAAESAASLRDIPEFASPEPSPEAAAISGESATELAQALATLSAEQRAAVELVYIAGYTYASAAQALGEPIGTIKSRVRLACDHLRARLAPHAR